MSKTVTLILGILVVFLGCAVYYFRSSIPGTTESKLLGPYVFQFEVDDVQEFTITRGDEQLTFQREGAGWRLQDKLSDAASPNAVGAILSLAQNLRAIDVINAKEIGSSLRHADFGLSKPKQRLRIKLPQRVLELYFGDEGPTDKTVFVRRADAKTVLLVGDSLVDAITQPVDEFRDRRLAAISADHIEKIRIRRPSFEMELQRKSIDQWEITSPLRTLADAQTVDTMLEQFLGAAILRFLPSTALPAGQLSNDSINEIKLWPEGEDDPISFRFGTPTPDEQQDAVLPVYSSARRDWFLIPAENADLANGTVTSLRSHYFFPLDPDTVDNIQLTVAGKVVLIRRAINEANPGEPEKWVRKLSGGLEVPVKQPVTQLIEKLSQVQATEFLPFNPNSPEGLALKDPAIKIDFNSWLSENTPEAISGNQHIAMLAIAHDSQGNLIAHVDDSPEICRLPSAVQSILDELVKASVGTED